MGKDLRDSDALRWIVLKDVLDKIAGFGRQPVRNLKASCYNLFAHDRFVIVVKWECSGQESVEDNSERPNVDLWSEVFLSHEHFRRCITAGP